MRDEVFSRIYHAASDAAADLNENEMFYLQACPRTLHNEHRRLSEPRTKIPFHGKDGTAACTEANVRSSRRAVLVVQDKKGAGRNRDLWALPLEASTRSTAVQLTQPWPVAILSPF